MAVILVALGGNALQRSGGAGDWAEARRHMRSSAEALVELLADGHALALTHGNGPQVGQLLRQNELAAREVPPRPLDVLGAESQGQIGYLVAQELEAAMRRAKLPHGVLVFVSRMEVKASDPAFRNPTKPVGRFYTDAESRPLRKLTGWTLAYDGARGGWRRVVPSPAPLLWVEAESVRAFLGRSWGGRVVPVIAGGGGVPVVRERAGGYRAVEAVIDKDRAAAVAGRALGAETLAIVTDVPGIAVGFRKSWERWLKDVSLDELEGHRKSGEFAEGTMGPKVDAILSFLRGGGRLGIVCDIPSLRRALRGDAGTRVSAGRR
ncbi:MAG: carbamate kinase [Thermoplasmata archaeon]|nr:carbamate kinase [Thermoplasmata archaeon]